MRQTDAHLDTLLVLGCQALQLSHREREKRGVCMVSLGKGQKVPRTGVDYTPMRIGEEKAARDRGLVELAGDLGWGAFSPQVPLTRAPSCAVESAPKQADSSRNTVSLPFIFPWNMG